MIAIEPVTHDLGAFKVRRVLPSRGRTMVGPFIFVDEFGPASMASGEGMDVRPHPHINLATVTYLFDGAIHHRDSLGTDQVIRPGAINLMTAGRGIVHSERSPAEERAAGGTLYGMQTWLALPDGKEEVDPAFDHVPESGLPLIEDTGVSARVLMGRLWGAEAAAHCHSPTIYADLRLNGGSLKIEPEADERAVMATEGTVTLDGTRLSLFTLYVLAPGAEVIVAGIGRAMLLGGGAFATPRHVWWNFVSSDRERIVQARADWTARRFPVVPGDEEEWIPIPEQPNTVSYP
ncbi:pirin family protein [Sphingomonas mesophila]|uniref:pirin family protein n=1 Tax=Sphingomonas mesophila TaxID=2303576 RepID=UPI000E5843BE|nr:pirin family protein [Sphingomonas mesophila]